MRITGGIARNISLRSPYKSNNIRPATDKCRQACFSSLQAYISNAQVLDLFAGTGSYGLEALSRGAKSCLFLEIDYQAVQCIKKNIKVLEKSFLEKDIPFTKVINQDVLVWLKKAKPVFDLIFVDPPYSFYKKHGIALINLLDYFLRKSSSFNLVFEGPSIVKVPSNSSLKCKKILGKNKNSPIISIFQKVAK